MAEAHTVRVIVAGLPRSGKSTGLNNIFNLNLPAGLSARPVTDRVLTVTTKIKNVTVSVTDTPGLKTPNASRDRIIMRDIKNLGLQHTFLLIVTLTVSQNSCITNDYRNILDNLTSIFGRDIWNWSLILLTSSDQVCDNQRYMEHLQDHCTELQRTLHGCGVRRSVRLISQYERRQAFQNESLDGIIAIPVGRDRNFPTNRLLPSKAWTHAYKWTELAFIEIAKLGRNIPDATIHRNALIQLRFGRYLIEDKVKTIFKAGAGGVAGGLVAGGAAGAGIGAGIGVLGGPVGIGIGAAVGVVAGAIGGAAVVGVGAGSVAAIVIRIDRMIEMEREEERQQQQKTALISSRS